MPKPASRQFCIAAYLRADGQVTYWTKEDVRMQIAVYRYLTDPCICDDCEAISDEIDRKGGRDATY